MRKESGTEKDIAPAIVCSAPWRLTKVRPLPNYVLEVHFFDGTHGTIEMKGLIMSPQAGVFAQLRDTGIFNQVYLDLGAPTWPGGLDFAPDAIHDEIKRNGKWIL